MVTQEITSDEYSYPYLSRSFTKANKLISNTNQINNLE